MPSNNRYRIASKFANQSAKYSGHFDDSASKCASKAITGLGRWATKDHMGVGQNTAQSAASGLP